MSQSTASILWQRDEGAAFIDNRYSRAHRWSFEGGTEVLASSATTVVPVPYSVAEAVDPEEAFVASLSSCHMLWFLSLAAKQGFVVESYSDEASGVLGKEASGRMAMTVVNLHPRVVFGGERRPSDVEFTALHESAHEQCFIANSVKTDVRCAALDVTV